MASNQTLCDKCGEIIASGGTTFTSSAFKIVGLPSKLDLCKTCAPQLAGITAGWLKDDDDDLDLDDDKK